MRYQFVKRWSVVTPQVPVMTGPIRAASMTPLARRLVCRLRQHMWTYGGTGDWTGYIERCERCGDVVQVPQ